LQQWKAKFALVRSNQCMLLGEQGNFIWRFIRTE